MAKEKKAFLKGSTLGEKWQYFKDYYMKATILIVIVAALLVGLVRDVRKGSRDCIFYGLVVNNYTDVSDAFRDDFITYAGLDDEKYNIIIDTTMQINIDGLDEMSTNYMQEIIAIASTKKQDVFLADAQIIEYYGDAEYIVDIRAYLSEEVLAPYEDQFYYREDADGNEVPVGIIVEDSPKLQEFGMYENQPPIFSVVYMAPDVENIQAFLAYLYE